MKLIKPAEISAKIMTLIDEAEKELIIVSPYNNITGWNKLINRVKKAHAKGVTIHWYSRKNNVDSNNANEVIKNLGIKPFLIDDLHAKIYLNEVSAIFTSMNMSKISDEKSLDLGYITENEEEYSEIKSFYKKHIVDVIEVKNHSDIIRTQADLKIPIIDTDEFWVKVIHKHVCKNYGKFKFKLHKDGPLEYFSFIKTGFKLQFIGYSQAIRVHLYLPSSVKQWDIEKRIRTDNTIRGLQKKDELEFCDDGNQKYLKYYFEDYDIKLSSWDDNKICRFLTNFDIIINSVFFN